MARLRSSNTRRGFLKRSGTAALAATALAGCSGSDGGDGSDGSSGDGSDGSSGDGSDGGGSTGGGEMPLVRMVHSPFGFEGIVWDLMLNATDRLENNMDAAGYRVEARESWEGSALFAAGGPDFAAFSPLEAATIASERELDLTVVGRMASFFTGFITQSGGPYDTATTGGLEASVRKIANEGQFAIGSWGGGDVHGYRVLMEDQYGLQFTEENSDFEIVTADYFALPGLAESGDVAAISTAPHYGAASMFASDDPTLTGLFWTSDELAELGYGPSAISAWATTQQFADDNPDAVDALVTAWQDSVEQFYEAPYELATQSTYMEMLAVESESHARWLVDWGVENEYGYKTPVMFEDSTYTEERIAQEGRFIDRAAELGEVNADWRDRVSFRTV